MPHTKIVLVGASGRLGQFILSSLLSFFPNATITALLRPSSKASLPSFVHRAILPDDPTPSNLLLLLRGQDVLITSLPPSTDTSLQRAIADAAYGSGVKLMIPADFGSCDSADPRTLETMKLYRAKRDVREYVASLATRAEKEGGVFGWTSMVCGHFFDYGLGTKLLGFDVEERKVKMFDGGTAKWSTCTRERIGEAVARAVMVDGGEDEGRRGKVRNRLLYVQSFAVSQREVLSTLKRVLGEGGKGEEWKIEEVDSGKLISRLKEEVERTGDSEKTEELVGVLGMTDADWRQRNGFANGVLGLEDEDLEVVVKRVTKEMEA